MFDEAEGEESRRPVIGFYNCTKDTEPWPSLLHTFGQYQKYVVGSREREQIAAVPCAKKLLLRAGCFFR